MAQDMDKQLQDLVQQVGIVRRWLVATALLKSTVLALGFVVAYVTLFVLLDHWCHFQSGARILAMVLFIVGVAALAIWRTSRFKASISFSQTADYIEGKRSFYRQLVTAMEYYENQQHYAYSRSLTQLLIRRIHKKTEDMNFSSFVNKWPTLGWASGVLIAALVVALFAVDNYHFFSRHITRLVSPTAAVEPVSKPKLKSVTKDILCEPNTIVKFTARLDSLSKESVTWTLTRANGIIGGDGVFLQEETNVRPTSQADGTTLFEHREFFEATGVFVYQFRGSQGKTETFHVTVSESPETEALQTRMGTPGLAAVVGPNDNDWECVTDHQIDAFAGSQVSIAVQASEELERLRQAYQCLRQFVDEPNLIYSPLSPGPASEEKQPEKIPSLVAPTQPLCAEQIQAEQHRIQPWLEDLQQQQERLNAAMERLLQAHAGQSASSGDPSESQDSTQAQLDMLRARQNAIRQESVLIKERLEKIQRSAGDSSIPSEVEQYLHQAQVLLRTLGPAQKLFIDPGNRDAHAGPAQMTQDLAAQFWSPSLKAQPQNTRPTPAEPSDIEFSSLEQSFFERVAEYGLELSEE